MNYTIEEIREELNRLEANGAIYTGMVGVDLWPKRFFTSANWRISWWTNNAPEEAPEQFYGHSGDEIADFMREKWGSFPGRVAVGDGLVDMIAVAHQAAGIPELRTGVSEVRDDADQT